jgi:hypothetical protein
MNGDESLATAFPNAKPQFDGLNARREDR